MKYQAQTAQSGLLQQNFEKQEEQSPSSGSGSNFQSGGPQFGGFQDDKGGWGKESKGWMSRYGSSIILPIIALLILAGGIYLYATQRQEIISPMPEENLSDIQDGLGLLNEDIIPDNNNIIDITEPTDNQDPIISIAPNTQVKDGVIIEKAAKGEGTTHLARRALKNYLERNPENLTNEHKVYIEDYLKDQIGSKSLEVNDEISFSEDLIQEAINASLQLNTEQLKVIEQYSALVTW
ncbi:MAG: hypothetical protein ABIC36_00385 [bacterium]